MPSDLRLPAQNSVTIIGRLTHDPELRYTQKGQGVCRFSIAVSRNYKDANGIWQEDVSFIPVVVWRDLGLRCSERLKKGSPVFVEGRLRSRSWEDKNGQKRTTLEVEARRVQFLQVESHLHQEEKNSTDIPTPVVEEIPSQEDNIPEEPF